MILWIDNSVVVKLFQFFCTEASPFCAKTLSPCLILYWVRMVLFVMMLVVGEGSTKVVIALTKFT